MNKERRDRIKRLGHSLEMTKNALEELRGVEEDIFDNLPDGIRDGEQGERVQTAANALEEAVSGLEDVLSNLETAIQE